MVHAFIVCVSVGARTKMEKQTGKHRHREKERETSCVYNGNIGVSVKRAVSTFSVLSLLWLCKCSSNSQIKRSETEPFNCKQRPFKSTQRTLQKALSKSRVPMRTWTTSMCLQWTLYNKCRGLTSKQFCFIRGTRIWLTQEEKTLSHGKKLTIVEDKGFYYLCRTKKGNLICFAAFHEQQ